MHAGSYFLLQTIMNEQVSSKQVDSVEVRWLSTMSFSDDGKVVKVQPGTKIWTEFRIFTQRHVRDALLRIRFALEMPRSVVIPDYPADSTAQVCLKRSVREGRKLLCFREFSTLIHSRDFHLSRGVH